MDLTELFADAILRAYKREPVDSRDDFACAFCDNCTRTDDVEEVHDDDCPVLVAKEYAKNQLVDVLIKARQDINWMLSNRRFPDDDTFNYIDEAIKRVSGA